MKNPQPLGRLAAIGAASVLLLTGCAAAPPPDSSATGPAAGAAAMQHIHALVPEQGSGDLLVGTHVGLYRVTVSADGSSTTEGPIGGLDFDPMGFTLSGGAAFASGHPGPSTPSSFGTPNLGLIRSEDGGETWTNVSLTGRTDFHALSVATPDGDPAGASIYALDSSTPALQRSFDGGLTWSDGAELVARDVLADPTRPAAVYATTQDGFAISSDEGATFTVDPLAPSLYLVARAEDGLLAGIDTSGTVWRQDPADGWVAGGSVTGVPQAMTVTGDRLYAADDRGVVFSDDWGASWTVLDVGAGAATG